MMEFKCPNSDPGVSKHNTHEKEIINIPIIRSNRVFNGHQSIFDNSVFFFNKTHRYMHL